MTSAVQIKTETNDIMKIHTFKNPPLTPISNILLHSYHNMSVTSPGSVTISGVVILQSPRPIDPQKGTRNVVFNANLCIVEGSQTVTMALLRYFAPNEMTSDIHNIGDKDFQKAFIVANV